MQWIDTHAHLNDSAFDARVVDVLDRAAQAGVSSVVVVGTDLDDSVKAVEMAHAHQPLFAAIGLQPNHLNDLRGHEWKEIEILARLDRVVAIGETGMDRYWEKVPIELQREYFLRHLDLADRTGKPVVIHCRDAEADVWDAIEEHVRGAGRPIKGVMHSYTGDARCAEKFVELGLFVSFAGMVTFKKNDQLRAVARSVPLERLLVETDSPYLSPEPFRGKPNEPCRVVQTGECLASALGISAAQIASATTENARRLFGIPSSVA